MLVHDARVDHFAVGARAVGHQDGIGVLVEQLVASVEPDLNHTVASCGKYLLRAYTVYEAWQLHRQSNILH